MRLPWVPLALLMVTACSDSTGPGVLEAPSGLSSVTLDGAVALTWSDNPYLADPNLFENYRVYSTSYDLDNDICGTDWDLEGTTVAPEFLVGSLTNGVPRCFTVTAAGSEGTESARSPIRSDTPRPDARNVVLLASDVALASSGFRFWDDLNHNGSVQADELGLIRSGGSVSIDFVLERDLGTLVMSPVRSQTGVELYSEDPVEDLTSIDFAADRTYRTSSIEAVPGYGYVFEMDGGDGFFRYGAIRVTHVGVNMVIFDWAFQTDPGNPELKIARGISTP